MTKKKIHIYCEGRSERNYLNALGKNKFLREKYSFKIYKEINDLDNAIKKSTNLEIDFRVAFFYDSDTYESKKNKITENIKEFKENIYFSKSEFEDFLKSHKTQNIYRKGKKPIIHLDLIKELENLDLSFIKNQVKKPTKFKDFKTIVSSQNLKVIQ
jgi:hypothetical protein